MTVAVPVTQQLADDVVAQIDGQTEQTTPLLQRTFTRVLAKVYAGGYVLLYKYAAWMQLQFFVEHASMRETLILGRKVRPLVELGRLYGAGDPLAATRAELSVRVTVLSQSGSIDAGRQLTHAPSGVVYVVTAGVLLNAPTVLVNVRAVSDQVGGDGLGAVGNQLPGSPVSFANPLPNISRDAVVEAQAVTGADEETEPAYRARVRRRVRSKPQGGASADYQQWGEEAAGIVQVFPYRGAPGQVDVYVEATPESSGDPDGIPTPAQLAAVKALIEYTQAGKASRRPVNAFVNALPIYRSAFDVVVTGLDADDLPAAQDAIEQAVDEYLRSREPFIVGLSDLPRLDRITQASISGIIDDVVSSLGGSVASVALKQGVNAIPSYTLGHGEKAKLGDVTFIS